MRGLFWANESPCRHASVLDAGPFAYVTIALLSVYVVGANQRIWVAKKSAKSVTAPWYPARRFSDSILL